MLVIGIDPGTASTGYGLVRQSSPEGNLEAIAYGVIKTPAALSDSQRLLLLNQELKMLIDLHRPQSGAVEKLFFQRNTKTAMAVGQARGVILMSLAHAGLEAAEYTPIEVKLAVSGYGAADKRQMQQMVRVLLGLKELPRPDDAADALAVAICHLHSYRLKTMESG